MESAAVWQNTPPGCSLLVRKLPFFIATTLLVKKVPRFAWTGQRQNVWSVTCLACYGEAVKKVPSSPEQESR